MRRGVGQGRSDTWWPDESTLTANVLQKRPVSCLDQRQNWFVGSFISTQTDFYITGCCKFRHFSSLLVFLWFPASDS